MPQLVECVPNFSEGRRRDVIEAIAAEVRQTPGARLLDVQADQSHNRCVITFVGDLRSVSHAALAATRRAVERIDMRSHRGEHPRLGAVDVIPFVPISGVSRAARESGGGMVAVQAMGVTSERGRAQVSMNLLDYTKTPVHQAFELIRAEAARYGVEILESEVVGLIPLDAVADAARFYLRLRAFRREQRLEATLMA